MNGKTNRCFRAHFDCQFGAAGDMLLGAMLDAGVDQTAWLSEIKKLALPENSFQIRVESVYRCSIRATKLEIDLGAHLLSPHSHDADPSHSHDADPSHSHSTGPAHLHSTDPSHSHIVSLNLEETAHSYREDHRGGPSSANDADGTPSLPGFLKQPEYNPTFGSKQNNASHERHLSEILGIISASEISSAAKDLSARIFTRLARAEAAVHGVSPEQVHFHEVGAIDAIIDIVGFAIAFDLAKITHASCTPVPLGSGRVKTAHGIFPVPAPAVVKLLEEVAAPSSAFHISFECLTPTGAAILCEITQQWDEQPAFAKIVDSGYGAGSKDTSNWPNVCRVIIGETTEIDDSRFESEPISIIEANIDDQSPQALAFAVDKIFAAGALDVIVVAATMKKSRSGHLLSVLCKPEDECRLQELVITETSSIGARAIRARRLLAARKFATVTMHDGSNIRIKLACDRNGKVVNAHPEFEDLAKYAMIQDVSLKEANARALAAFAQQKREE